jgi:PAS domain S-box-containing protein
MEDIKPVASTFKAYSDDFARDLINSLFSFVGVMTPDGRLLEANRTALESADLKPEDVVGKLFPETYWWSYCESLQARLWRAIHEAAQGIPSRFDAEIRVRGQQRRIIDFMLVPMRDGTGQVNFLVPSAIDVTERKQLEEASRENEARLAMATESGEIGTWDWNMSSNELIWDKQMLRIFGYPSDSGLNKTFEDFVRRVHPEDKDRLNLEIKLALASGLFKCEFRIVLQNGSIRWILGHGRVFHDDSGKPKRMLGINRDVTEVKHSIEQLQDRESRLAMALDVAQLGAFTWSTGTHNRQLSPTAKKLITSDRDLLTESEFLNLVHPADRQIIAEAIARALREHRDYSIEYRVIQKDGGVHWIWERGKVLVDFLDLKVTGVSGVMQDVTSMKEAEAQRRAIESQRKAIEGRDEFISVAAHELKTPVQSLMLEIQLLRSLIERDEPKEKLIERSNRAEQSARHLTKLTGELFDVTLLRTGKFQLTLERMDLAELVSEVVEAVKLFEKSAGPIDIQVKPGLCGDWDRTRVAQVVGNLVRNAVKYGAGSPIEVHAFQEDDFAVLSITDHGPGIPEEVQHKIFERFERAGASGIPGGMGLGLYICQLLVAAHQGTISVHSRPGEGASFVVRLPLGSSP